MPNSLKLFLAVLIVAAIAVGAWFFFASTLPVENEAPAVETPSDIQHESVEMPSQSVTEEAAGETQAAPENGVSPAADNASIDQDISDIDRELQGLNEDNNNIDAGLNDTSDLTPIQ